MAYFLLRAHPDVKCVDFDVPESLGLAAYYLGQSMPGTRMLLFGEAEFTPDSLACYDAC